MNHSKLPHSLRLAVFLLRLALGINFFYLGFATLFNQTLGRQLSGRSFGDLYGWLDAANAASEWHNAIQWAFLIIGACLVLGLLTRTASLAGIVLVLAHYLPGLTMNTITPLQFVNDEVIAVISLLILFFAHAGTYLGLDMFLHFRLFSRNKK